VVVPPLPKRRKIDLNQTVFTDHVGDTIEMIADLSDYLNLLTAAQTQCKLSDAAVTAAETAMHEIRGQAHAWKEHTHALTSKINAMRSTIEKQWPTALRSSHSTTSEASASSSSSSSSASTHPASNSVSS
jgi:hypothetical protein